VPEIEPHTLAEWLDRNQAVQLVDARTSLEFWQGTIGNARHAPLARMPEAIERLNLDPGTPVVVLCLSGHRSLPGTRWLRARGFEAYSLRGGVLAWKRARHSLVIPPEVIPS
jgi:rhodanese-related sulfurtransferase